MAKLLEPFNWYICIQRQQQKTIKRDLASDKRTFPEWRITSSVQCYFSFYGLKNWPFRFQLSGTGSRSLASRAPLLMQTSWSGSWQITREYLIMYNQFKPKPTPIRGYWIMRSRRTPCPLCTYSRTYCSAGFPNACTSTWLRRIYIIRAWIWYWPNVLLARFMFYFPFSDVSPSNSFVVQAGSLRGKGSVDGIICLIAW